MLGKKASEIAFKKFKQHDPHSYFYHQIDASNHKNRKIIRRMCSVQQYGIQSRELILLSFLRMLMKVQMKCLDV